MNLINKATQKKYINPQIKIKYFNGKDVVFSSYQQENDLTNVKNDDIVYDIGILDEKEIEMVLCEEIENFFPKTGAWYSNCFSRSKEINRAYLPCNLRNSKWLSELFHKELKKNRYMSVPVDKIYDYITSSERFRELRHNYELEIVRWQIEFMKNNGEGWIMPDGYDDFGMFGPNADSFFREGVIKTLSSIGLNKQSIEEGLEKNANMWRDTYMKITFRNIFEPVGYLAKEPLVSASKQHKENWLKLRKYQYYLEHKESVDNYGSIEPCMQMTEKEVEVLKNILKEQNKERRLEIQKWRNSNYGYSDCFKN